MTFNVSINLIKMKNKLEQSCAITKIKLIIKHLQFFNAPLILGMLRDSITTIGLNKLGLSWAKLSSSCDWALLQL